MEMMELKSLPFEGANDIEKYKDYYSERGFWRKIKSLTRKTGEMVLSPMVQLYYVLQDGKVSLKHKAYIIGALGYFILPFDLIPESILPVIGFTDDIAVATLVLKLVKENLTPAILEKSRIKVAELLSD